MQTTLHSIYQSRKNQYAGELQVLQKKHNRLGWLRLALILIIIITAYQVFALAGAWAWLVVGMGIALFLWLVSADAENNRKIGYLKQLVLLNEEELRILAGDFAHRPDGLAYLPSVHPYAHDLDLFGTYSLYQLINRCSGEQGRALLANNLLQALGITEVLRRQEAANEIASMIAWRQQLQASAALNPLTTTTEQKLKNWLSQPSATMNERFWSVFVPIYSLLACSVALAAILDLVSGSLFSLCFIAFILFSFTVGRRATPVAAQLSGVVAQLETLQQVLTVVEEPAFRSPLLRELQSGLQVSGTGASSQIRSLKEILNRFDLRLNVFVFLFINSFLLWDIRQLLALKRWRRSNEQQAAIWFETVAQFEVLTSLATLRFNNPGWAQPKFVSGYFEWEGETIGHPLLKEEQRVCSDFALSGKGQVALITGSNMAGKSTFLRSLGVNTVLAQMGAVVCAQSLSLSPVVLMSSMRIADNLAENTSTFYAELKKLKSIIDAVKEGQPLFILLDEILRGTNSLDRHTGSKALIGQLLKAQRVAVLATHDVELARLESLYPNQLANYHFDVQVAGQELYFDYKLKQGVCTNLNASVLMQKIGIEL
ncbi:MutS domain V [Cnuella takakiae]|uniref:MutS domain V n=1 Tax=Cnuella takakiae TaxID=1302690 RepID=A0A1M4XT75_9BACT|nr:hypothetical protein [Cnuella takakiae]SHE96638.1 MutS domain V [Cnuella takakiae]